MVVVIGIGIWLGLRWLAANPAHDPRRPLRLHEPLSWATPIKLDRALADPAACRTALATGAGVAMLPAVGTDACRTEDRLALDAAVPDTLALRPGRADATCAVALGLHLWIDRAVQPAAALELGSRVVAIDHLGTRSCRRIAGSERWSQHATGNAIDIAGFVLADGRRVSVRRDWTGDTPQARFLRAVRDGACPWFSITLSPDYNAAHADHLHLDQSPRGGLCR